MAKKSSTTYLFAIAGLAVVALIGYSAFKPEAPSVYNEFARCLDEQGAEFYGAWWCPHCADQKEMFGSAEKDLPYIECSPGRDRRAVSPVCEQEGITGYPTWKFPDGTVVPGVMTLKQLADQTGCELPDAQ